MGFPEMTITAPEASDKPFFWGIFNEWTRLKLGATALSILLLASIWVFTLQRFENEERLVLENAQASQHNLAVTISENLNQLLNRGKLFTIFASLWIDDQKNPVAEARMTSMRGTDQAFSRMVVFDRSGQEVFASSPSSGDSTLTPAVKQVLMGNKPGQHAGVIVGPIPKTLSGAWHIPLLYPILNQHGEPRGALLLVLDLGYVLQLTQNVSIGNTEVINITTDDGQELVRSSLAGIEFDGSPIIASGLNAARTGGRSVMPISLFNNQAARLVAYQQATQYPFAILVSQDASDVLKTFRAEKRESLIVLSLLTVGVLVSTMVIVLGIQQRRQSFMALVASENEKKELIFRLNDEKRRAYDLAAKDHLTGLCNRRMFMELASHHLSQAKRNRLHYAVLFIDLDRFKAINDSLGHHVGDLLLRTVASRLVETLRESDVVARFGGDEFVLMLAGLEHEEDVTGVAQKVIETVSQPCVDLAGHTLQIYPSIGISFFPRDGQDVETLLRNADLAMYQSKQSRSRSYSFFDASLNMENILEFDLEQRFSKALEQGEFVLHFQPKVDLSSYRIVGLEALIRWQHPEHGLIFPNAFIPLAENTGHIVELGKWVIEEACRQLAAWQAEGVPVVPVAVNVSADQLKDHAVVKHMAHCMSKYAIDPQLLQIEVTESHLVENVEVAGQVLDQFVQAGMHIALDDYGTGFSSLGYIKTLPIHTLKIDRSFIKDIRNSYDDAVIVSSTIALAHDLGLRVIAEGVESKEQLVYLKTSGCDEVQGYFFSRPVPDDTTRQLLLKGTLQP